MDIQSDRSELENAQRRYEWRRDEFNKRFQRAINIAYDKSYQTSEACAYAFGATDKFADHIKLKLFERLYIQEIRKKQNGKVSKM